MLFLALSLCLPVRGAGVVARLFGVSRVIGARVGWSAVAAEGSGRRRGDVVFALSLCLPVRGAGVVARLFAVSRVIRARGATVRPCDLATRARGLPAARRASEASAPS